MKNVSEYYKLVGDCGFIFDSESLFWKYPKNGIYSTKFTDVFLDFLIEKLNKSEFVTLLTSLKYIYDDYPLIKGRVEKNIEVAEGLLVQCATQHDIILMCPGYYHKYDGYKFKLHNGIYEQNGILINIYTNISFSRKTEEPYLLIVNRKDSPIPIFDGKFNFIYNLINKLNDFLKTNCPRCQREVSGCVNCWWCNFKLI